MKTKVIVLALTCFGVVCSLAQGTITWISPTVGNGSFEDGSLTPWAGNGIGVQNNPSFATDGSWYAAFNDPLLNPLAIQNLPAIPDDGLVFMLSFDARTGTPGLNRVSVQMNTRAASSPLRAVVTPISAPPLSLTEWQSYQMELRFPVGGWTTPLNLGITFNGGASGPLIAYLDNVVLTQIPEPSALALAGIGGLLLAGTRFVGAKRLVDQVEPLSYIASWDGANVRR